MATSREDISTLKITPLSPAIGVEIGGIDLRQELHPDTIAEIRLAWCDHSIMLIRGQDLTEADQFRFARTLGTIAPRSRPPVEKRDYVPDPDNPMHLVTDRVDEKGRRLGSLGHGEMWFHTDKCYEERPHRASLLYALEIPSSGGETKFASLYCAYDRLPASLKEKLEGRRVLQIYDFTTTEPAVTDDRLEELMHYWQPIFVTNPDTGRRALYASRLMSARIEGMEEPESRDVLAALCDLIEAPDNIYEHSWRPGDLIVWDNLSTLHARNDWPADERRTLRRCTV
ncbi:MAG: TauD/TfdA family dioxygenase, partial [Proteobacteria bacterium]|nr:TauD/TfdA family dioxygenase [Pseudomonadota bacterium]